MVYWLGITVAYLILAFAGSAMLVRFAPRHVVGQLLRRHLWLFPVAPLMAGLVALPQTVAGSIEYFVRLFEKLSGRRQYVRYRFTPYGYERERRKNHGRRASDKMPNDRAVRGARGSQPDPHAPSDHSPLM